MIGKVSGDCAFFESIWDRYRLSCSDSGTGIGCGCESRCRTPQVEKYRIRGYGSGFGHGYGDTEYYNFYNIFVQSNICPIFEKVPITLHQVHCPSFLTKSRALKKMILLRTCSRKIEYRLVILKSQFFKDETKYKYNLLPLSKKSKQNKYIVTFVTS